MAEHDPFTVDETKKKQGEIVERYENRKTGDVQRIVSTVEGRRFIWRILVEAKVYQSCFDVNALTMAMNEGRRDLGLFVTNEILKAKPEAMEQMRSEAASDRLSREAELLNANKGDKPNG